MSYPCSFTAVVYNTYDTETNEFHYALTSGVFIASSFADAAATIESAYGDDLVAIKEIRLYEENSIIYLPTKIIDDYIYNDNWDFPSCDTKGEIKE